MKASRSSYIPTLDGWRAIAILLVLFDHALARVPFIPHAWTRLGGHGVQIFFILSGYLITGKLLEDDSLKTFYTRRAFRILPVVLAYIAMISILGFGLHRIPLLGSEVVSSLLFVRNYHGVSSFASSLPFTGHLWSLSVEEQFYLVWPLLMLMIVKGSAREQLRRALWFFSLGNAIFFVMQLTILKHLGNVLGFYTGLAVGCILRLALSEMRANVAIRKAFSGRSAVAAVILMVYLVVFHSHGTVFDPLFCGLAVCSTLVEPGAWAGRFLELSVLRWIGHLSYSLYIWQQLFLGYGPVYLPFGFLSRFPLNLASLVAISCLSYYFMERPLIRLGCRIASVASIHKSGAADCAVSGLASDVVAVRGASWSE